MNVKCQPEISNMIQIPICPPPLCILKKVCVCVGYVFGPHFFESMLPLSGTSPPLKSIMYIHRRTGNKGIYGQFPWLAA